MSGFKTILAIDTAMNGCGVTVLRDGGGGVDECVVSRRMMMNRGQAEHLLPLVEEVLAEAGVVYADLDAIVTTAGPGAFTGLRIGLSTARSLALALSIPVYGMTTLQVFALGYSDGHEGGENVAVLIDTKRDDFYVQLFDAEGYAQSDARALLAGDVVQYLDGRAGVFVGDVLARFQGALDGGAPKGEYLEGYDLPSTEVMARALSQGRFEFVHENPVPIYLRDADVSLSSKVQRVLVK